MRTWKSVLDAARDQLAATPDERFCGYCRWWSWPGETCSYGAADRYADYVRAFDPACVHYAPARGCATCKHYLSGGQCAVGLEKECRDGGFEAWEAK